MTLIKMQFDATMTRHWPSTTTSWHLRFPVIHIESTAECFHLSTNHLQLCIYWIVCNFPVSSIRWCWTTLSNRCSHYAAKHLSMTWNAANEWTEKNANEQRHIVSKRVAVEESVHCDSNINSILSHSTDSRACVNITDRKMEKTRKSFFPVWSSSYHQCYVSQVQLGVCCTDVAPITKHSAIHMCSNNGISEKCDIYHILCAHGTDTHSHTRHFKLCLNILFPSSVLPSAQTPPPPLKP